MFHYRAVIRREIPFGFAQGRLCAAFGFGMTRFERLFGGIILIYVHQVLAS
jgi:hypothetical protein